MNFIWHFDIWSFLLFIIYNTNGWIQIVKNPFPTMTNSRKKMDDRRFKIEGSTERPRDYSPILLIIINFIWRFDQNKNKSVKMNFIWYLILFTIYYL